MAVDNLGAVYERHGYYGKAEEMYKLVLAREEKTLGTEHSDTLATVNNLALLFDAMGQYDKALEYYQRALVAREKALGTEHPDTLTYGQYDKALEYYQRALVGREKALGTEHPDTLTTVNNIAALFQDMGQHNKALEYFQRALVGCEKALGTEHPDTLTTVTTLAVYSKIWDSMTSTRVLSASIGWTRKALAQNPQPLLLQSTTLPLYFKIWDSMTKHLSTFSEHWLDVKSTGHTTPRHSYYSPQHWQCIQDMDSMTSTRVLSASIGRSRKGTGTEHLDTLTIVNNIAALYEAMGQYDKALEYSQRALVGRHKVLGLDHPDTLATINYMATLLGKIGHSDQAQKLRERTSHGSSANANE
ncbi:hypothetical protein BDZ91DRAFT_802000 [Kalaharituber pfeilii]|nr:hypothetical protein BDZ91DRAFT_802000 [Kalaharituber pfeilii]